MGLKKIVFPLLVSLITVMDFPCKCQEIDEKSIVMHASRNLKPVIPRPDTVSFIFLGDIMLHSDQIENAALEFRKNPGNAAACGHDAFDFSHYFSEIQEYISRADLAVANMEFTLGGEPFSGYPSFSAPDSYAEYFAGCGIDVFLTANNHILDRGKSGAERTLEKYSILHDRFGTMHTGTFADSVRFRDSNPLVTEVNGIRTALVNFTYGTNKSINGEYPAVNRTEKHRLVHLMERAENSGADLIIALPHWGEEYSLHHSEAQHELAVWLAEHGADIIIGAHPHVVQDSTILEVGRGMFTGKKVPVIYSLGNAISNMSAPNTQIGLMAEVRAVKLMNGTVRMLPVEFTFLWCSLPGRLKDTHCTIPVKEYLTKYGSWRMPYEYEKMLDTYVRVKAETGIID